MYVATVWNPQYAQPTGPGANRGKEHPMAVNANLDAILDKAYESATLAELVDAPVAALSGVSEGDAEHLLKAFNIKTVGDLANNKYFRAATAIVEMAVIAK